MTIAQLFDLEPHGPDTYVGAGRQYPWGGLYGGHIVAQALRAAASSVDGTMEPHSMRSYFIRRGDPSEPVRYEVDRIRDGKSFCTRRVVARQTVGAILNLEASFQASEESPDVQTIRFPTGVPSPDSVENSSWSEVFDRRAIEPSLMPDDGREGAGRSMGWFRITEALGDPQDPVHQLVHRCAFTYLSDDLPSESVDRAHPVRANDPDPHGNYYGASLDHTVWFHRTMRADEWHLHDFTCHSLSNSRGLSIGHVFSVDGTHVATVAQEFLLREAR
ncbi:MAG: thioesterase family protein [Actinomycetota bacterium]|nr:thioesterase family protein [Actinomycetota bacterium]MDA3012142.1 thioesterase family protein [Actinomycetota bacterium]MDA3024333.1 thioesterase family protein [Actinomycetota bacterium]